MSIIDKMLSEAAVAENSNAASEVSTEDNANVDCPTFEKTQSQVFGNSFSIVFMGIYAEEKDMSMLRPDIEFVLKKTVTIADCAVLKRSVSLIRSMKIQYREFPIPILHTPMILR